MGPPPTIQERAGSSGSNDRHSFRSKDKKPEKAPDLLCRVRYTNTLPDIPFDPKFLSCLFVDLNRFVDYKQTSLEKNYKHELLTEPDLGVNIDLINPDTYKIDHDLEIVKLDPADEALLEEEQKNVHESKRSIHHSKVVPWMRKTEYISSEFNRFGTSSDRQETKVGYNIKKRLKEENIYRDRNSQIEAINKTFEDVRQPVSQHYSKPGVMAIQEMPLLPDFDLWKYPFAQVIFDTDPSPLGASPQEAQDKMSQALIRGMMDEQGEQFVAYFLPTDETLKKRTEDADNKKQYQSDAEYDYKLAREYNWTVKNKASKGYEENYFLVMREDGVYYNELETRVRLSRRRAKEGQKVGNSRLVVTHREQTEAEVAVQDARLMQLSTVDTVEEEEEEGAAGGEGTAVREGGGSPPPGEREEGSASPKRKIDEDDDASPAKKSKQDEERETKESASDKNSPGLSSEDSD